MIRSSKTQSCWDVAVVGGGIGGLTAGAVLARAGARVVVCEQHTRAGGYCHSWSRAVHSQGRRLKFTFDAAVHDISGAFPGGSVWTILTSLGLNNELDWGRVSHEYWLTSTAFHVDEDPDVYISSLKLRFPSEAKGIDQFFSIFRKCYEDLYSYATLFGGLPRAPRNSDEMRKFRERCPTLAEFIGVSYVEMRDSLLRDLELRRIVSVLSVYITDDVGKLSFANMLPLFGYYFRGGHYPRGGSQALANVLAKGIKEMGGQIRLRAPVARINVLDGCAIGLILRDGTGLRADAVISNADTAQTFGNLVDARHLPKRLATAASAFQPSNSAFMVFLGLNAEPQLASSTIIMEENTGVIVSRPPFAEDRAPKGYTSITLTGLVSANEAEEWRGKPAMYNQMKRDAGDRLIALASRRIPDIAHQIVYREEGSPATLQRYTWATGAAAYGSTPGTRWPNHETPIKGLYVVGASTGLGPGIEAVMVGGASLAGLIGSRTTVCSALNF